MTACCMQCLFIFLVNIPKKFSKNSAGKFKVIQPSRIQSHENQTLRYCLKSYDFASTMDAQIIDELWFAPEKLIICRSPPQCTIARFPVIWPRVQKGNIIPSYFNSSWHCIQRFEYDAWRILFIKCFWFTYFQIY